MPSWYGRRSSQLWSKNTNCAPAQVLCGDCAGISATVARTSSGRTLGHRMPGWPPARSVRTEVQEVPSSMRNIGFPPRNVGFFELYSSTPRRKNQRMSLASYLTRRVIRARVHLELAFTTKASAPHPPTLKSLVPLEETHSRAERR